MANVGELSVLLKANTKQASQKLKGFGQGVSNSFAQMKVGIMAVGAAITAFATISLKKFLDVGDQLHKMSLRTNIAVEELDKLRLVFELSGASIEGFEKGMMTLQRQLLAGAQGSKLSADAFKELGLRIEDIQDMGARELFMAVAEGLAAIEGDTKRSAIAMQLLGRFGTQMNSVLAEGMEGFRDISKEAEEMTYWTTESATKSAELNDSITLLKQSTSQLGHELAVVLAPALIAVADASTNTIQTLKKADTESKDFWKTITSIGKTIPVLSAGFIAADAAIRHFWEETETAEKKVKRLAEIDTKLADFLVIDRDITNELVTARTNLNDVTEDLNTNTLAYTTSVVKNISQLHRGFAVISNSTTEFGAHGEAIALTIEQYIALMLKIDDFNKKMNEAVDITKDLNKALGLDMHGEMLKINEAAEQALKKAKQEHEARDKAEGRTVVGGGAGENRVLTFTTAGEVAANMNDYQNKGGMVGGVE